MTCGRCLVALVWLAFAVGTVSCGSDGPQGSSGSAGSGGNAGSGGSGVPSRGPLTDAGSGIVVVGGSGGAAGAAGGPAGAGGAAGVGGGDGGTTLVMCPDGVRGNDIACDSTVDVICISDCMNNSRIRCGCTSRGMGGDRWVCGGQPQDCQQ